MQIGVDTFVASPRDGAAAGGATARVARLLEEVTLAEQVGLDRYSIGEHHRPDYLSSAPAVLLGAAAVVTRRIRLASAVTVLSSDDPVRVFQQFATVDLLSGGRAEIIVGRGSFTESYPLFGYDLEDYDALFSEKLDLLLKLREAEAVHWSGRFRPPLTGQGVYPRPVQQPLPVMLGVGGTPASFVRAGRLGLPLVLAIIGGEPHRFRPLVDRYREAGREAGHAPAQLSVGVHTLGLIADTSALAAENFWPAYRDLFTRLGRERGWGAPTRPLYDALRGPAGALLVGGPDEVAAKIRHIDMSLGGVDRFSVLLDNGLLEHAQVMRAIELLGTRVAPQVRGAVRA
jgi:probable LLM family oxidoreductase